MSLVKEEIQTAAEMNTMPSEDEGRCREMEQKPRNSMNANKPEAARRDTENRLSSRALKRKQSWTPRSRNSCLQNSGVLNFHILSNESK